MGGSISSGATGRRFDATMLLIFVLAFALIVGIVVRAPDKVQLLLSGPTWPKVLFIAFSLGAILSLAGAQAVLDRASARHAHQQVQDAQRREQAVDERLRQHDRQLEEERSQRSALQAAVHELQLSQGARAIVSDAVRDDLAESTRVSVRDQADREIFYMVFHLYRNAAYWDYEGYEIESANGTRLTLTQLLSRSPAASRDLPTYDYVIGVGIASNPQEQTEARFAFSERIANERAASMCASLMSFSSLRAHGERVWGMALGRYTGAPAPALSEAERAQRTIVIVGVKRIATTPASVESLVQEIVAQVNLPGLDVSLFSRARPPLRPVFYRMSECSFQ